MATTEQYLRQLQADKQTLVNNLVEKGVSATEEETFTSLVPKVLDIQSGGSGAEEYFKTTAAPTGVMREFIKKVPSIELPGRLTLANFFDGFSGLEQLPNLDTSAITNMYYMCYNCSSLKKVGNYDYSKVSTLEYTYGRCSGLCEHNILNTPNCTNFKYAFSGAFDSTSDNIVTMEDMSKGTNMQSMFESSNVTDVNFNNTQNVTNMRNLFRDTKRIKSITGLDTSSCTNISQMFYLSNNMSRPNLTEVPEMNTSKVTDMGSMFYNWRDVITIPELNAESCITLTTMFYRTSGLVNFGGLKDIGKAYLTSSSANYSNYKLDLKECTNLTYDSLMNVINGLYDIATKGCNAQALVLGTTNLAKLTEEEIAIATNKGWNVS